MKNIVPKMICCTGIFLGLAFVQNTKQKGIDVAAIDRAVQPGADFYRFANGTWLKENPIPASESRWGSFNIVAERNNLVLREILESVANDKTATKGSAKDKVGTFYRLFLDEAKREKQGVSPAKADLDDINNLKNKNEIIPLIAKFHRKGIRSFFGFYIGQDLKNSTAYIPYISQGGLGLPDRDYYFKTDAKSQKIREEYVKHVWLLKRLWLSHR